MIRPTPRDFIATAVALAAFHAPAVSRAEAAPVPAMRAVPTALPVPVVHSPEPGCAASWDTRLIHQCGFWTYYDLTRRRSSWPLPFARSAAELGEIGERENVLRTEPQVGDLFLMYNVRRKEYVHAGIVTAVMGGGRLTRTRCYVDVATVEGDTNECGLRRGGRAMQLARRLLPSTGDRFLRWVDLGRRELRIPTPRVGECLLAEREVNPPMPAPVLNGDASLAVERTWPLFESSLRERARRMTRCVDDQNDLVQEALIELWSADPTRYDLEDPREVAYLRRILVNRMLDVWGGRDERPITVAEAIGAGIPATALRRS